MAAFVLAATVSFEFEEEEDDDVAVAEGLEDRVASTVFPGQAVAWGTPVIVVGTTTPEGTEIWSILTTSVGAG